MICHTGHEEESMHIDGDEDLDIGCADCHGGDPAETTDKKKAHVARPQRRGDEKSRAPQRGLE